MEKKVEMEKSYELIATDTLHFLMTILLGFTKRFWQARSTFLLTLIPTPRT